MSEILTQFIRSFQRAVSAEMNAMRQQLGPFEVNLTTPRLVDVVDSPDGRRVFYAFDVIIVEEAAMAVLPTLFYCAALAKAPIVQSKTEYVYQAMGRNIFEIAVPNDLKHH